MNAIEFVKKYDFDMAKHTVLNMPKGWSECYLKESNLEFVKSPPCVSDWVCMNDIKQIVDAFELVERFGGIEHARNERDFRREQNILQRYDAELSAAINLMEKCL